jgi:hypothetical protein
MNCPIATPATPSRCPDRSSWVSERSMLPIA